MYTYSKFYPNPFSRYGDECEQTCTLNVLHLSNVLRKLKKKLLYLHYIGVLTYLIYTYLRH